MSENEKKEYVCLRCGNVYSSRAKVPQCPICKSRKKLELDKFLALPKEQQEKILGKLKGGKKSEDNVKSVKSEEKVEKSEEKSVKYDEPQKITAKYEESESVKYDEVRRNQREKAKGEKVKKGIPIPKPKFGFGVKALMVAIGLAYILYKLGFFESLVNHLKTLGAFAKSKPKEEIGVESNPLLEKAKRNLSG